MGMDQGLYKVPKLPERESPVIAWDEHDFSKQYLKNVEEIVYWRKLNEISSIIRNIHSFNPSYTEYFIITKEQLIQLLDKLKRAFIFEDEQEKYDAAMRTIQLVIDKIDHDEWSILYYQSE